MAEPEPEPYGVDPLDVPGTPTGPSTAQVIAGASVGVVGIAAAATVLLVLDGEAGLGAATLLFGQVGLLLGVLGLGRPLRQLGRQTAQLQRHTDQLRNGALDAKIRAGVADVLPDHLVDPAKWQQLEHDRELRRRLALEVAEDVLRRRERDEHKRWGTSSGRGEFGP